MKRNSTLPHLDSANYTQKATATRVRGVLEVGIHKGNLHMKENEHIPSPLCESENYIILHTQLSTSSCNSNNSMVCLLSSYPE